MSLLYSRFSNTTHVRISHLVASLPTSRQQVVFALLVPSCQQLLNSSLTIVTTLLILSDLLQGCSNKSDTIFFCVGVVYSGEYDICDVTLSVYPHRASLKNMPGHGGKRTYDPWIPAGHVSLIQS